MKEKHTILCPQMSPIHFRFVEAVLKHQGFHVVVLPDTDFAAVDEGLKYVNNDACYPSILVVGQMIKALKSGSMMSTTHPASSRRQDGLPGYKLCGISQKSTERRWIF